jgi:hypothetical protein
MSTGESISKQWAAGSSNEEWTYLDLASLAFDAARSELLMRSDGAHCARVGEAPSKEEMVVIRLCEK